MAAKGFPRKKVFDGGFFIMPGRFCFHALRCLPSAAVDDGGHTAGDIVISENIGPQITFGFQNVVQLIDGEELSGFGALARVG